ncbi:MAG: SapC family protein [Pseudomonadales bacterium]|jgi:hypothetical protein|nr:SapC family protein [Pseudomonadales bacterium]
MFKNLLPVNRERHAGTRILPNRDFRFVADNHVAAVTLHEFGRAGGTYPIVFIEDKQNDLFRPVALLGLEVGENLFVDAEGKWSAQYVPAIIRRYPFALAGPDEQDNYAVCIDEGADVVGEDPEGLPLFDESGEPAEALENVRRYLSELQQMDMMTRTCCEFLAEHNMFTQMNMRLREGEQVRNVAGCYVVNEERLNNLSDELFLEMRRRGYLGAIYAHLTSLGQMDRLVRLRQAAAERAAA